jgi:hypothetical protein
VTVLSVLTLAAVADGAVVALAILAVWLSGSESGPEVIHRTRLFIGTASIPLGFALVLAYVLIAIGRPDLAAPFQALVFVAGAAVASLVTGMYWPRRER